VLFQHRPSVLRQRPNGRASRTKLATAPRRCCFNTGHPARRSSLLSTGSYRTVGPTDQMPKAADQSVSAAAGRCSVPAYCRHAYGYKVGPALVAANLVVHLMAATVDHYTHPGEVIPSRVGTRLSSAGATQAHVRRPPDLVHTEDDSGGVADVRRCARTAPCIGNKH